MDENNKLNNPDNQATEIVGRFFFLGFEPFLNELSDDGFANVKEKFIAEREKLADHFYQSTEFELLKLLCEQGIINGFDRTLFAKLLNCFFRLKGVELGKFKMYVNRLKSTLDEPRIKHIGGPDACIALEHLHELENCLYRSIEEGKPREILQYEVIQYLVDIYKTISCLGNIDENSKYCFEISKLSLNNTNSRLQDLLDEKIYDGMLDYESVQKKVNVDVHVQLIINYNRYFREKRYIIFLSWILTELICDQDGITEESEEKNNE